jgi:hypothetical protein
MKTTNPHIAAAMEASGEVFEYEPSDEALRIAGAAGVLGDPDVLASPGVRACVESKEKNDVR